MEKLNFIQEYDNIENIENLEKTSDIKEIEEIIVQKFFEIDLLTAHSPYLPHTFSQWRRSLFSIYTGDLFSYIDLVDHVYLPRFLKLISNAYHFEIVNDPMLSDFPKEEEGVLEIIQILTEWSLELELAVDLIERAKLYGFYEIPYGYHDLFTELKSEWKSPEKASNKIYKFCMKYLSFGAQQAKDLVTDSAKSYVVNNLIKSRGSIIASMLYAYFCSTFPWPVVALLGSQCAWIFSTILITKVGEKVAKTLDKAQLFHKIRGLKVELEGMISDLMHRNEISRELIRMCLDGKENSKRELAEHFNNVLSHKRQCVKSQKMFDEDQFVAEHAKISEENEWTVIEPPEIEVELIEDWMIL